MPSASSGHEENCSKGPICMGTNARSQELSPAVGVRLVGQQTDSLFNHLAHVDLVCLFVKREESESLVPDMYLL